MRKHLRVGLLAVAAACTVVLGSGMASASGGWTIQSTYYPRNAPIKDIGLEGVSCSASNACLAIGHAGAKLLWETWNGTKWSPRVMAYPAKGEEVSDVSCSGQAACTAVGVAVRATSYSPLAERWNGTSWQGQPVPGPADAGLGGVSCPGAHSCIAVGGYGKRVRTSATLAEMWNGTKWAIQPTPPTGHRYADLSEVSCPTSTDCVAVGDQGTLSRLVPLIERWDGTRWAIQKTPVLPSRSLPTLSSVSCAAAASCTAIGYHETSSGEEPLVERWNGTTWVLQHVPGATNDVLGVVSCPAATSCTATGWYPTGANTSAPLAAHWNGTAWALQYPPNPPHSRRGSLNDVSCPTTTACEAVGFFQPSMSPGNFRDKTLIEAN
jgi:hypothetical protein